MPLHWNNIITREYNGDWRELWENHDFGESEALRLSDDNAINGIKIVFFCIAILFFLSRAIGVLWSLKVSGDTIGKNEKVLNRQRWKIYKKIK